MGLKISVQHWRFESGEPEAVDMQYQLNLRLYPSGFKDTPPRGWYCWCYPNSTEQFKDWMEANCPTADITHRFNSGDPMWQTYINDEKEAAVFMLRWL